jgi:hypothetical protein
MAIFDLYSKRKKRESAKEPDIYVYDNIPKTLKVQVVYIWREVIGVPTIDRWGDVDSIASVYQFLIQALRKEHGKFRLSDKTRDELNPKYAFAELCDYFLLDKPVDDDLSVIELTMKYIDRVLRDNEPWKSELFDGAINEFNIRCNEQAVGYQYADGEIIRRDSEFVHNEAVKPTLLVLRGDIYKSAQEEFLSAHEHYRHGKMTEALVDACKAFESTMKIICGKRKWKFDQARPASHLIQVCFDNGLIPAYWQTYFSHLRGMLEASISTARNKQAGHGAGSSPPHDPPGELVAYVLHMTASTILFLTEAEKALP